MKKILQIIFKYSILGAYGGFMYVTIELLYRQFSTIEMMYAGALAFIFCGLINIIIPWEMSLIKQALIGGFLIITPLEYLFGILFNRDYRIWCYLGYPLNINGQVCLLFSCIWCLLSVVAIIIDDYMRYWLFNEEKPHYHIYGKCKNK